MPWQGVCPMELRMRLVNALIAEEDSVAAVCEEYGVSRKTGYKWLSRFRAQGPAGLAERSHAAHVVPWAMSQAQTEAIVALRRQHPSWGPKKLRAKLLARALGDADVFLVGAEKSYVPPPQRYDPRLDHFHNLPPDPDEDGIGTHRWEIAITGMSGDTIGNCAWRAVDLAKAPALQGITRELPPPWRTRLVLGVANDPQMSAAGDRAVGQRRDYRSQQPGVFGRQVIPVSVNQGVADDDRAAVSGAEQVGDVGV